MFISSRGTKLSPGEYVKLSPPHFLAEVKGKKKMWLYFSEANQTRYLAKGLWNVTSNTS